MRQKVKFTRQRAHTTEKGKTEKETGTYGHIRPSSFGVPRLFFGRHLWSSPVGLGFSTRLSQAADSLSGERILTPLLALNALRCGRFVCFVTLQACCALERWSGAGATIVDVKTHLRHVLHFLLATHRFCQEVRWVVVGAHLVNLPSFTSCCFSRYWTSMCLVSSSQGLGDALCQ